MDHGVDEEDFCSDKVIQNPQEFMRKIGWLGGEASSPQNLNLSPNPRSHRRTRSGDHGPDSKDKLKPKRRGKRHRKQGSCTFPPKSGFPFDDPSGSKDSPTARSPNPHHKKAGNKRSAGKSHQTI
mmetsp:Transcript_87771/g.131627  ORF Transcript_87771/g.131627 Transcript_87771/m.131627 type:complete len:125 (+) Transcript_87771:1-375(+)